MKKIVLWFWASCLIFVNLAHSICGITNSTKCGRLGDQLVELAETIYLAEKHQLPLYLTPFKDSDAFKCSDLFQKRPKGMEELHFRRVEDLDFKYVENRLYVLNMTSGVLTKPHYVEWKNPEFVRRLREYFALKREVKTVTLPKGKVSIALHIRNGGTFDKEKQKEALARKFTSIPFVVESVKKLLAYYKNKPLYIHVFTDDVNPKMVLAEVRKQISDKRIQWGVLENPDMFSDLVSMTKFDALVTSSSNYSFVAWVLGNHQITMRQTKAHYDQGKIIVDEFEVVGRDGKKISF